MLTLGVGKFAGKLVGNCDVYRGTGRESLTGLKA